ncbi:MAG: polyphosphate kinase 1 [Salinispira sp.]
MQDYSHNSRYFNRELSWIEFNRRVLNEALREEGPLLERLRFLSIVSSNFDEFFMVRVAGLKAEYLTGNHSNCQTGMTPEQQLSGIYTEYREISEVQEQCLWEKLLPGLADEGIRYITLSEFDRNLTGKIRSPFMAEYFPLLTPFRVNEDEPLTRSGNMRLYVGILLGQKGQKKLSVVQLPSSVKRIVRLPAPENEYHFTFLENLVVCFAQDLFPGYEIIEHLVFRITRDANFAVNEDRDNDFVEAMEEVLAERFESDAVRLSCTNTSPIIRDMIREQLKLTNSEIFETREAPGLGDFMDIVNVPGFDHLRSEPRKPVEILPENEEFSIWEWIRSRDRILFHPFDSFNPVLKLLEEAAEDEGVLAIKMTLYRTSRNSPVVAALERAARNGKQVTALVELKARFDERRNIHWAERLEKSGVIVIYGIAELKVHAKSLLIVRREEQTVRRYLHVSTGNYNEKTAKVYTDIGILSAQENLCYEAGLFFNAISGYSAVSSLHSLTMAPHSLKAKILQLIQREIDKHSPANPSHIIVKCNSLSDGDIIESLYEASQAGVRIDLNIRGICMLKPGVPGLSENIRVISIIDHYLEHSRALYFHNGGTPEVFISSADWMSRNLDRRVELLIPIEDKKLADEILHMLNVYIQSSAYELQSDGQYTRDLPYPSAQDELSKRAREKKHMKDQEQLTDVFNVRRRK